MSLKAMGMRFAPVAPAWGPLPVTMVPRHTSTRRTASSRRESRSSSAVDEGDRGPGLSSGAVVEDEGDGEHGEGDTKCTAQQGRDSA